MKQDDPASSIFVAGHRGMVGSALVRRLQAMGQGPILTATHAELDLTRQADVEAWFAEHRPAQVYLAAAKVGGIHANNTYPAEFIHDNLMMEANIIHAAHRHGVQKLLFLGSSCIYPRMAPQPMREDALLTSPLEPTNEPYAIAKIAGIKLCESYNRQYGRDYRSVMPTNLYGPGDNYHAENSHVIPALLRRFHEAVQAGAASVTIWGTGTPMREFLHADDLADACVFLMTRYSGLDAFNVGTGKEVSIREFVETVAKVAGYKGRLEFDTSKPNGAPRKLTDPSRLMALGWKPAYDLESGLAHAYRWYVENKAPKAA